MKELTNSKFNLFLGLFILYGVLVNVLISFLMAGHEFTSAQMIAVLVLSLVCGIAGVFVALKNDRPIVSFLGYNMLVIPFGLMLSMIVQLYSPMVVFEAFFLTAMIMFVMIIAATIIPEWFKGLGTVLFIALIGLIIAEVICVFIGITPLWISAISALIFSCYIGYDWTMAQAGPKTLDAAIDSALNIYLDIVNLFLDLLRIVGDNK
jgi:FtsH-binding integral membrane protein